MSRKFTWVLSEQPSIFSVASFRYVIDLNVFILIYLRKLSNSHSVWWYERAGEQGKADTYYKAFANVQPFRPPAVGFIVLRDDNPIFPPVAVDRLIDGAVSGNDWLRQARTLFGGEPGRLFAYRPHYSLVELGSHIVMILDRRSLTF